MVLACILASAACRQQAAREAEARAKRWGIPAVRIVRDLVYAEYGLRRLRLDLYRPPASRQQGAVPGVLVVRGGAWQRGDKEFFGYVAGALAMEGFAAASIEYRTADEAVFPAAVHDVKAAVRWMRANAAMYDLNPDTIGAIGGSAGAHLVAMLATSTAAKLEGEGGNSTASSAVQAVVAMGGAYNLQGKQAVRPEVIHAVTRFIGAPLEANTEALAAASPVRYVNNGSAPLLLLHSPTDPLAPFRQSVEMEQVYRRAGAPVALKAVEAPGIHAFWVYPRYFPEAKREAVEFFRKHLKAAR